MDLTPFQQLVRKKTGLSFENHSSGKLASALQTRMAERGMSSSEEYLQTLLGERSEFKTLVNLITINETYFYREPAHLRLFAEHLVPELLSIAKPRKRIRILSAGCATGEEPYSFAIALMEKMGMGAAELFSVTGVDLDTEALSRAKAGIYRGRSFRDFDSSLLGKYFEEVGDGGYRIRDTVKRMVEFQELNLLSDPYPESLQTIDVVLYRNVSIYFDAETQARIFTSLSKVLSPGGYLILSSTETLSHNLNVLPLTEIGGAFLYCKTGAQPNIERETSGRGERERGRRGAAAALSAGAFCKDGATLSSPSLRVSPSPRLKLHSTALGKAAPSSAPTRPGSAGLLSLPEILSLASGKKYREALKAAEKLLAADSSSAGVRTLKANLLLNLDRLDEAAEECLKAVQLDGLSLEGYLLLGMVARRRNDHETAERRFKEAVYVRLSCWLPHFYLAETHELRGEKEKAMREYKIVIGLLEKGGFADSGLSFFPLSIPADQMIYLCRSRLGVSDPLRAGNERMR